jgi:hypothetical protein
MSRKQMANGKKIAICMRAAFVASMMMTVLAGCEGQSMDQVFGIGDANPASEDPTPKPTPRPTPTPTPRPSPSGTPPTSLLKRNVAFDVIRSRGIAQVKQAMENKNEAEIGAAVATFNSAYRLKPNDRSIQIWLDAIAQGREKARAKGAGGANAFMNPQPGQPGMPQPGMPGAAPYPGQPGMPPAAPPVPPPNPAVAQPATQIDPRLVF